MSFYRRIFIIQIIVSPLWTQNLNGFYNAKTYLNGRFPSALCNFIKESPLTKLYPGE